MQRWNDVSLAGGIHISLNRRRDMCIPCFFVLLLKEISSISSNTSSNTTRVKTGIKQQAKTQNCGAHRGIHISLNRRRDICIPCFFVLLLKEISSISSNTSSNTTRVKTGIKQHAKTQNCGAHRGDTHITEPAGIPSVTFPVDSRSPYQITIDISYDVSVLGIPW